tara:strand:- start:224 stop:352 length:129 start_codon:yes stop_codon:yes gene_type:complete
MGWKFLWQLTFIVGIIIFIVMFFIFAFKGYKDIMAIIKNKND